MTLKELLDIFAVNKEFWVIVLLSIVEITPIKIKPWSFIFEWIGRRTNVALSNKIDNIENSQKEMSDKVGGMQTQIDVMKREFEVKNANDWRWDILDFFNSSRNNRPHSKEEWEHAIDQVKKYEKHVERHEIDNGVLEEASRWLRNEYQKHIDANDFLDT